MTPQGEFQINRIIDARPVRAGQLQGRVAVCLAVKPQRLFLHEVQRCSRVCVGVIRWRRSLAGNRFRSLNQSTLREETDFTLSAELDRWDRQDL
jgi:hypothetical protein